MDNIEYQLATAKGTSGRVFISCSKPVEDDNGIITRQTGFLEVSSAKAESVLEKLTNGELAVRFGQRNTQGLFEVKSFVPAAVNAPAANELEHA